MHIHEYVYGPLMHGGQFEDWCGDCGKTIAVYKTRCRFVKDKTINVEKIGNEERIES